ncbi:MAG TPA: alcohol dehydrogenase catalytic domain-containing protein [Actinomycetota bacterium]|jgi:threonine dehydrogenase-like Zn-dependent dehydrogenase|nr:alcohol dehydrogenase catalytic domain-containing protein [Actinomycetota bacterium]
MRAVVFVQNAVRVDDVPPPRIQEPGDAIVRVSQTSICGSDLHLLEGKTPGMRDGSVIGHEFVGVVVESGPAATKHPEGTRVVGSFLIACGRCTACRARRFNHCDERRALGLGTLTGDLDGAQAELVRVPDADVNLLALQGHLASLSDENALFAGDVLTTGMYAAHLAEAAEGESVTVVGGGPIGLFAAAAARSMGAAVRVVDADEERVKLARERFGFDAGLTPGETESDAAVEAVGSVGALKTAMRAVRPGGRIAVIGVYGRERYDLPLGTVWARGLDLRFSGMANIQAHWLDALAAVSSGEIEPGRAVTHRLPLERAEEGYQLFRERRALKVVLTP